MIMNNKETELFENDIETRLLVFYYYNIKQAYSKRPFKVLPAEIVEEMQKRYNVLMSEQEAELLQEYAEDSYVQDVLDNLNEEDNLPI